MIQLSRSVSAVLGAVLVLALCGSFLFGGKEARHRTFDPPFSGLDNGYTLGTTRFFALAGSGIDIDYRVKIERGLFAVRLLRLKSGLGGPSPGLWKAEVSGEGHWSGRLAETGFYTILCDGEGTRGSRGYDVDYRVTWRITPNLPR